MKRMFLPLLLLPAIASAEMVVVDELSPPVGAVAPIIQIKPIPVPKEAWVGESGSSMKATIMAWAGKAHWNVVWDTKTDYPLLAPVKFEGHFDEVVAQFIHLYEVAEQPLVADIQPQQNLIYITNRKP